MAKRPSLAGFTPIGATAGRVEASAAPAQESKPSTKYPKVSVYLTADEVRSLKLIALDQEKRLSDVCAQAIREWLERKGHARSTTHNA